MGIFQDTVPKALYDEMAKRYDDLLEKYHQLRQSGASLPQPIKQHAAKSVESAARSLVENAAANPEIAEAALKLQREHGITAEQALKEAVKAREIITGKVTAPYSGHNQPTISI